MTEIKPFHETVAEKLIEKIRIQQAPWQQPLNPDHPRTGWPINPISGKRYQGINGLQLMSEGREDRRWLTAEQVHAFGGAKVNPGETGTTVQYWQFTEQQPQRDAQGNPVLNALGEPETTTVKLERPRAVTTQVFNVEQTDAGDLFPMSEKPFMSRDQKSARVENIVNASGVKREHTEGSELYDARYQRSNDAIQLPQKWKYTTGNGYHVAALRGVTEATAHESRLNRDTAYPPGSYSHTKAQLTTEIATMLVGETVGVGHRPRQQVQSALWVKALKNDPLEIVRAAAEAEKIYDYVMGLDRTQQQAQTVEKEQTQMLEQKQPPSPSPALQQEGQTHTPPSMLATAGKIAVGASSHLARGAVDAIKERVDKKVHQFNERVARTVGGRIASAIEEKMAAKEADPRLWEGSIGGEEKGAADTVLNAFIRRFKAQDFGEPLDIAANKAFGFTVPKDWNGGVHLQQVNVNASGESGTVGLYAQTHNGDATLLKDYVSLADAAQAQERLLFAAAKIEDNPLKKGVILARINESQVRGDANSTDEEKSAAKQQRETAEKMAMTHTEDQQKTQKALNEQAVSRRGKRDQKAQRTYLSVPFTEKDEVKKLGAKWDKQARLWYVPGNVDRAPFAQWQRSAQKDQSSPRVQPSVAEKTYLAVPYGERLVAKAAGAKWDREAKSWYADGQGDTEKLQRWLPENVSREQGPAVSPLDEFAEALRALGCRVEGQHPVMDGSKQRIAVDSDKPGQKSGFYVGHLDGLPAGYMKNNRTGLEMKWQSKGYALSEQEKATLNASAAKKLAQREKDTQQKQSAAAERVNELLSSLTPMTKPTPYFERKGIQPEKETNALSALTDADGKKTYIPAYDIDGKVWTLQTIDEEGKKRFQEEGKKQGTFHVIGGLDALASAPALVVAEGYATAKTAAEALGFATVAAFDAGNLATVVSQLQEKYPDDAVVVIGDDDRHLEMTQGVNPGRSKAEAAAKAVGGKAVFPVFASSESGYPNDLPVVTPKAFRQKQLSEAQTQALDRMKQFTDFNDLANRSEYGSEGVIRQLTHAVERAVKQSRSVADARKLNQSVEGQHPVMESLQGKTVNSPNRSDQASVKKRGKVMESKPDHQHQKKITKKRSRSMG